MVDVKEESYKALYVKCRYQPKKKKYSCKVRAIIDDEKLDWKIIDNIDGIQLDGCSGIYGYVKKNELEFKPSSFMTIDDLEEAFLTEDEEKWIRKWDVLDWYSMKVEVREIKPENFKLITFRHVRDYPCE